ncbi:MAG: hypothetical protein M1423_05855, partial [Acidobacteria bacterium]|nr:hypothetical protein [Acidobacteriota bacterium]
MADQTEENKRETQPPEADLLENEQPETPPTPLERFLRKFREACQGSRPPSPATRKELGKDKSKALFVLVAAAIAIFLFFLAIFSSPQKPKRQQMWRHDGQPDLGRRITPGQAQQRAGSVTPLLNAETQNQAVLSNGEVTPEDIKRTSQMNLENGIVTPNTTANTLLPPSPVSRSNAEGGTTQTSAPPANQSGGQQYALGHVNFPDTALQQEYAKAGYSPDYTPTIAPNSTVATSPKSDEDLKKASLVFVRNENAMASLTQNATSGGNPVETHVAVGVAAPSLDSILPPGTRLVARLESPASTAVAGPVVAAIEYNYEQDGEIVVPAGSKAIGKLEQANPSGYVSLHFTQMEFPDETSEKIDGIS